MFNLIQNIWRKLVLILLGDNIQEKILSKLILEVNYGIKKNFMGKIMKNSLLIIAISLLIFNFQFSFAQNQAQVRIDSLLKELPKAKEDTNKVNLLIALSYEYYYDNPDNGIKYSELAIKSAENLNWKNGLASALNVFAICQTVKSNFPIALECFFKALNIYEQLNLKKSIATVLGHIGIVYSEQADFKKTLEYYYKALKISEELNDKRGISSNLQNIGNVYSKQSDYNKALEFYFKALKYHEELGAKKAIAMNLSNIGNAYRFLFDFEKAVEYYLKGLKISEESNDKFGEVMNLGNIGGLYINLSKDSQFYKSNMGKKYIGNPKKTNLNIGISYSLKAVELCKEIGALNMLNEWYINLYEGYKQIGNFEKALSFHELYKDTQDTMFNKEKATKFANLEAKRETLLKEKEIEKLNSEQHHQSVIRNYLIGIAVLGFILTLLTLYLYRIKKRDNVLLNEKNIIISDANIELDLLNSQLSKQNHELTYLYKELQDSEDKYRNIFENSTIGIYRTTPDGRIITANRALLNILKYDSFEELSQLNLDDEQPNQNYSRKDFKEQIEEKGRMIGLEGIWIAKDGSEIYIRESVILIKDQNDKSIYYDGVVEDISEKRKSELALIESENKLKKSNDTKDKFFSIIAHDLKNPLAALITGSDVLFTYYNKFDDTDRLKYIEKLSESSRFLSKLLENLLQWSRSQTNNIEFAPEMHSINEIVAEVFDLLSLSFNDKKLNFIYNTEEDICTNFDRNMINTVIRNILTNAIKYSNVGGLIKLEKKIVDNNVKISIIDNGVGILTTNLEKLFRIDSTITTNGTNDEKGTGLGLILCKEFVEKHRGKIWAESIEGKGSTFFFTLPA